MNRRRLVREIYLDILIQHTELALADTKDSFMTSLVELDAALVWKPGMPLGHKIHYACGRNVLDGWVNTDYFDTHSYPMGEVPPEIAGKVFHVDLAQRHPFPDNSFQYAYSEDFIEHLLLKDAITFLFEVRRCLKPGGVFRISTPGFNGVFDRHYVGREFEQLATEHYQCFDRWGHLNLFNHETLRIAAHAAGFSRYQERIYGRSDYSELTGLDTRSEQVEFNIYAELTK